MFFFFFAKTANLTLKNMLVLYFVSNFVMSFSWFVSCEKYSNFWPFSTCTFNFRKYYWFFLANLYYIGRKQGLKDHILLITWGNSTINCWGFSIPRHLLKVKGMHLYWAIGSHAKYWRLFFTMQVFPQLFSLSILKLFFWWALYFIICKYFYCSNLMLLRIIHFCETNLCKRAEFLESLKKPHKRICIFTE